MRRIAAQYLFTGRGPLIRRGVITLDAQGVVLEIGQLSDVESCSTEFYNGLLAPGLVNAHCHLELSHMRGMLPQHLGLGGFIEAMTGWSGRLPGTEEQEAAMTAVDRQFRAEGVVAVGDISNTANSFPCKSRSGIYYHTFVEAVGLSPAVAPAKKMTARQVLAEAQRLHLPSGITPHAAYSMSDDLFAFALQEGQKAGIYSIHNQEGEEEAKTGLQRLMPFLDAATRVLLVHNTFSTATDIETVEAITPNAVWVLCPNSNRYISDVLPPADLLYRKGVRVALGTDSFSSNTALSVLEELKSLSAAYPQIPLENLLEWATSGGAMALNKETEFGWLAPGRTPGLVLIEGVDFDHMRLRPDASARRL